MIIGIQVDHIISTMIRKKIIDKISDVCDLPLTNTWDSVLDEGICKGTTNWQLFGSKKPNHDAYDLTHYYEIEFDESDAEFMMESKEIKDFKQNINVNFHKLSAQNTNLPKFEINPKIDSAYKKLQETANKKKSKTSNIKIVSPKEKKTKGEKNGIENMEDINISDLEEEEEEETEVSLSLGDISNAEMLERAVSQMLKRLKPNESDILETHQYTQILPPKYYEYR